MDKITFTHEVRDQEITIEKCETWATAVGEYEVVVQRDRSGTEMSIYRNGTAGKAFPLGILKCHPESVDAIEHFAEVATPLFTAIAAALRELGQDDLRSEFRKSCDAETAQILGPDAHFESAKGRELLPTPPPDTRRMRMD